MTDLLPAARFMFYVECKEMLSHNKAGERRYPPVELRDKKNLKKPDWIENQNSQNQQSFQWVTTL